MMSSMKAKSPKPGSGKTVMHSKPNALGQGSVRMPAQQPPARINVPRDHKCSVCPGANRMK
jgi:hypothetical protein